jgi:ubiquinone/menaquinone biosynthesis C-methylase UbiE
MSDMKSHAQPKQPKDTSWNTVSDWYDDLLKTDSDSYQAKVIAPNLIRMLDIQKGECVFDLACGQGYFANIFAQAGAKVVASDLSKRLIERARKDSDKSISYYIAPAHKAPFLKDASVDTIVIILAIQNIENVNDVFAECKRVLKKDGRLIIVLNHPAFRVPQGSDWYFHDATQYRIVGKYMSESKIVIDMTPGEKNLKKKIKTISFHRPLQYYVKLFAKNGLAITRLEEWISHKKSQKGPRQSAEDTARKEIPMFMCIEVRRIKVL